jgi:excisionase family DNA binding protein
LSHPLESLAIADLPKAREAGVPLSGKPAEAVTAHSHHTGNGRITRSTPFDELPDMLSPDECRAYLALGRSTIYDLLRSGQIPHKRFGRCIRIPKRGLQTLATDGLE